MLLKMNAICMPCLGWQNTRVFNVEVVTGEKEKSIFVFNSGRVVSKVSKKLSLLFLISYFLQNNECNVKITSKMSDNLESSIPLCLF